MTSYTLRNANPSTIRADVVVIGVLAGDKGPNAAPGGEAVADTYGRRFGALLASLDVTGKAGTTATVVVGDELRASRLILVGLGAEVTPTAVRRATGVAARAVKNATNLALALPADSPELVRAVTEGYGLGGYVFDHYKSDASKSKTPAEVVVLSGIARQKEALSAFERAQQITARVLSARSWVNHPANVLNPVTFADEILEQHAALTKGRGAPKVGIEVWDEERLTEDGCGGILGVGGGSQIPPRLVKLTWDPAGATSHVAIIGKGITYDSGGYSIKPAASMVTMKEDMAGAAAAVQATFLAAELGLPVRLTTYAALAENMISGSAMRPGDVLTVHGGTTVEVTNTDAEGRLVMADAFSMATGDEPDVILDIATLTGHMVVALGTRLAGIMGDDETVAAVRAASEIAGEPFWPMPIPEEMKERVASSKIADLAQHDGVRFGGGLFAAAFLREFTGGLPWAHLDIAGPAFNSGAPWNHHPSGATGFGVATLVEYLTDFAQAN